MKAVDAFNVDRTLGERGVEVLHGLSRPNRRVTRRILSRGFRLSWRGIYFFFSSTHVGEVGVMFAVSALGTIEPLHGINGIPPLKVSNPTLLNSVFTKRVGHPA